MSERFSFPMPENESVPDFSGIRRFEKMPPDPEVEDELYFEWGIGPELLPLLAEFREAEDLADPKLLAAVRTAIDRASKEGLDDIAQMSGLSRPEDPTVDYTDQEKANADAALYKCKDLVTFEEWRRREAGQG